MQLRTSRPLGHVAVGCLFQSISQPTQSLIERLTAAGALVYPIPGTSDLPLSRNIQLTHLLTLAEKNDRSVVISIDDDMDARVEDVVRLCTWPRPDAPAPLRGAVYCKGNGELSSSRLEERASRIGLVEGLTPPARPWVVGFGLLAVQTAALRRVAESLQTFRVKDLQVWEFCTAGVQFGRWFGDDGSFCLRFGGAHLDHTVTAGHFKHTTLWPDKEQLADIRDGKPLGEPMAAGL